MVVERGIFVQVEIAVLPDTLSQDAPVTEVDPAPETDALPNPACLHYLGGQVIEEVSRVLQLVLVQAAEEVFQDLGSGGLVLSQKGPAIYR